MLDLPWDAGAREPVRSSIPRPNAGGARRGHQDFANATKSFTAKSDRIFFEAVAPGGGSGSASSATIPPGAGGGGESAIGSIPMVKGKRYTVTIGVVGAAAIAAGSGVSTDGGDAGDMILKGPGVLMVLKGGGKGLGAGTGGIGGGTNSTSPLGYSTFKGGDGGASITSNIGNPGVAVTSSVPGGLPGAGSPSGPGGGATLLGRGGNGGSSLAVGNQSPDVDSGAGAGAPGAGNSAVGQIGAAGRKGSFRWWWYE